MSKFFRRTRYSLLNKNHAEKLESKKGLNRKYLKYAIGEILLVVIGILIALQINNWNIASSNEKIEQQYIKRLINEIDQEIIYYSNLKNRFTVQQKSVNELLTIWNQFPLTTIDTIEFWPTFFTSIGSGPWYKEPVTWRQLVQSGELKFIQDKTAIEELFKHYSNLEQIAKNFNEYPTQTTSDVRKFVASIYSETDLLISEMNFRPFNQNPKFLAKILENRSQFRRLFVRVGVIAGFYKSNMDELIESAESVKEYLVRNLKTD